MDNEIINNNNSLYIYSEKGIKIRNEKLWYLVSNHLLDDISFKEKFYLYENRLDKPPICYCGNALKFSDMVKGYRKFCSRRCVLDNKDLKEKKKKTCLEKYGVDNPSKSDKIKSKVKKTNLLKFGSEYPLQSKEIMDKMRSDLIDKWGVDNPSKIPGVRKKAQDTILKKYGVEHAMQNQDVKESLAKYFLNKYGVTNPSYLPEVRKKERITNNR